MDSVFLIMEGNQNVFPLQPLDLEIRQQCGQGRVEESEEVRYYRGKVILQMRSTWDLQR